MRKLWGKLCLVAVVCLFLNVSSASALIYCISDILSAVATIDPASGQGTIVGPTGYYTGNGGAAFDDEGNLYTIDLMTGLATFVAQTGIDLPHGGDIFTGTPGQPNVQAWGGQYFWPAWKRDDNRRRHAGPGPAGDRSH